MTIRMNIIGVIYNALLLPMLRNKPHMGLLAHCS